MSTSGTTLKQMTFRCSATTVSLYNAVYTKISELTPEILNTFVNKIVIYENRNHDFTIKKLTFSSRISGLSKMTITTFCHGCWSINGLYHERIKMLQKKNECGWFITAEVVEKSGWTYLTTASGRLQKTTGSVESNPWQKCRCMRSRLLYCH